MTTPVAKSALAAAVADAMPEPDEQLDLLVPSRFAGQEGAFEQRAQAAALAAIKRDRAGRPAGSGNIATREMLAYVRRVFGDPVERRARWLLHTPETLAKELSCTPLEAFDRLDRIAQELARLFYAPLAPVDAKGNPVPATLLMAFGGQLVGAPGSQPPWIYAGGPVVDVPANAEPAGAQMQQNQSLRAPADDVSLEHVSHDKPK